jgi:thiol-disulfide isomerase/thioredoxin
MKKYMLLLFISTLLISCSKTPEKNTVILNGKIQNNQSNDIGIILFDNFITRDTKTITTQLNNEGEFELILQIDIPQYALLSRHRSNHPLYLYPGDSLYITFNDNDILQTLTFKGIGANHNNLLSEYFEKYSLNNFFKVMKEKNVEEFKNHLLSVRQEEHEFLNRALLETKLHNDFISYLNAMIKYQFYTMMFMQKGYYAYANKVPNDSLILPENYYDFIDEKDFNDDSALINTDDYLGALSHFISHKLGSKKFDTYDQYFQAMYNYSKLNLKNKTRDFFIGNKIVQKIERTQSIDDSVYQDFINICKSSNVRNIVEKIYLKNKSINELVGSTFPKNILHSKLITEANNQILLKDLLEMCRGNIVYIDIWSLGCGPCMSELPHSKELINKYRNEEIKFIFFSVDKTDEMWKKGIEISGIKDGHYKLDKGFDSELLKTLNIKGIPRYLMIDENGNIISLDSKRPSSKELIRELNKLLDA